MYQSTWQVHALVQEIQKNKITSQFRIDQVMRTNTPKAHIFAYVAAKQNAAALGMRSACCNIIHLCQNVFLIGICLTRTEGLKSP